MGVFSKENQPDLGRKRNPFDGSFQNNLTFNFGQLVPCMCREVIGGDSFRISTAFGLRFMPTAFPLQTKMKAKIDFFYVRYRNLWSQWKNWYMKTGKPDAFPVLSAAEAKAQSTTCSLGDYLGLPSTIVQPHVSIIDAPIEFPPAEGDDSLVINVDAYGDAPAKSWSNLDSVGDTIYPNFGIFADQNSGEWYSLTPDSLSTMETFAHENGLIYTKLPFIGDTSKFVDCVSNGSIVLGLYVTDRYVDSHSYPVSVNHAPGKPYFVVRDGSIWVCVKYFNPTDYLFIFAFPGYKRGRDPYFPAVGVQLGNHLPSLYFSTDDTAYNIVDYGVFAADVPYKISALPFRAYEQIYNAFYRDDRNNPYFVDGVNDPNVFLPTYDGGVDDNKYRIRYRNWEQDFLTTALPSPQYGNAPLVGITESGDASFQLEDGSTVTSRLSVGDDGDTVVGFNTTKNASVNRSLVELASVGISINDLRGVNSMQRFLEAKYRRSLRYRDQMMAQHGVDIRYDELDMPEFLGSVTSMVNVDQINQNSASTTDNPLGSYAGQLSAMGGSNGRIQHYFDEPGLVIAIVSVVPVPCYSQLLPKHFTKVNDSLEYYFPAFAHLGYQAISYREVCPLQASVNGVSLDSTFGYQRPWYDYISAVDEIHGQFRTTLNNFVMARVFNQVPSLNEEFVTVRPESLNDVFTISEVEDPQNPDKKIPIDTILGQIHFDIVMQRPIPRFGVARLE